jgi:hypothetical protein
MKTIAKFLKHHIDPRYLLTPIASTVWGFNDGVKKRFIYVFGIRIISYTL